MQASTQAVAPTRAYRTRDALDGDVEAFNAAFEELELGWHWDRALLEALGPADDRARVARFLERQCPHLLKVYEEAFLVELIVTAKARWGKPAQ